MIETRRVGAQVPFPEDRGPVTHLLEELGKGHLVGIESVPVSLEAILVAVFARQDTGPAWATDRGGAKVRLEQSAFLGDAVDVGRMIDLGTIGRDGLGGVIIREDEYNVGLGRLQIYGLQNESACQQ